MRPKLAMNEKTYEEAKKIIDKTSHAEKIMRPCRLNSLGICGLTDHSVTRDEGGKH